MGDVRGRAVEESAKALMNVKAVPDVLFGCEGDLPMCCAAFRVSVDAATETATDARCVYASKEYCRAISRDIEGVVGRSYLEIGEGDVDAWLARCYRVIALGETVTDFGYDPLVRDWTCSTLAPSLVEDCCVYAFIRVPIDDNQRKQLMASADARTSLFISEMLSDLAAEQSYHAAMNGMLAKMAEVVHADRMSVFECSGDETKVTFELLADGVESQLGSVFGLSKKVLGYWFRNVTRDHVVLVPNVSVVERMSKPLYQWCRASGVDSLLAAPFFCDGEMVGFLGAYNYQIDETVDLNRLFGAVATFIGARIENRQLIDNLRQASRHDVLTGLYNRRGSEQAIRECLKERPDGRHALILLDLDDFKRVNDVYGHNAGDEALRAMARALHDTFPRGSIVSRNGGDEFLVFLSGDAARDVAILLSQLSERGLVFEYEGESHQLTISAGYARYPEQSDNVQGLLNKADAALYAVKLSGKAGFGKYTSEAEDHMRIRLGFSTHDILESIPYPVLVCRADRRGEILFASSELADMLGYGSPYSLMRLTGGTYTGIVCSRDCERVTGYVERLVVGGGTDTQASADFGIVTRDLTVKEVHAEFRLVEIRDSGKVLYTYFFSKGYAGV